VSLYRRVRLIAPGIDLDRPRALAAAARSRGETTSVDAALRETREALAGLSPPPVPDRAARRRRVTEMAADLERHRERVATLRGRVRAGDDVDAEYRDAIRTLSEVETELAAAEEALETARERAREARDVRERRLRLQDRCSNLERTARGELRAAVLSDLEGALAALPARDPPSFEAADPVSAALALVRIGRIERPVTLACRRFPDRGSAERWLGTPVVRF